jgi:hypothetical protein
MWSVDEIENVVGGVIYLESAPFVTGEVLHIEGGQSAGHCPWGCRLGPAPQSPKLISSEACLVCRQG